MQIKHKKDGTWQELYPNTLAANVKLNDGRTLQEYKEDVDNRFPEQVPLWTGERYPNEEQEVKPSKLLANCVNGWLLRWQAYTPGTGTSNSNFQYSEIPKIHLVGNEGRAIRFVLARTGGIPVHKYVYVHNDKIVGHATNEADDNGRIALTGVFEY